VGWRGQENISALGMYEKPRTAKRRRLRTVPAVSTSLGVRRSRPCLSPSTASHEVNNVQPRASYKCASTLVDDGQHNASRTSQSPSITKAAVLAAEYEEFAFHGLLKCTRIGEDMTYNIQFTLPLISELLKPPINPEALAICSSREALSKSRVAAKNIAHSKKHQAPSQLVQKRFPWTTEEDAILLKMKDKGNCSWEEICVALPNHTSGSIQVRYSTRRRRG
jgi:hypothetical protein